MLGNREEKALHEELEPRRKQGLTRESDRVQSQQREREPGGSRDHDDREMER